MKLEFTVKTHCATLYTVVWLDSLKNTSRGYKDHKSKGENVRVHAMKAQGEFQVQLLSFILKAALDGGELSASHVICFIFLWRNDRCSSKRRLRVSQRVSREFVTDHTQFPLFEL